MNRLSGCALSITLCAALVGGTLQQTARAQGDALLELYGEGVHRYFAGDYMGADQLLSRVVDGGSLDPRAHYFRGLVREMQGGGGLYDFETGARLEAEGKRVVGVGEALARIQGATRSKIEKARRDARVMARQQQLMMEEARRNTLGVPNVVPSETLPPVAPQPPAADDLFGEDGGMRSDATVPDATQPVAPEIDSATDPFGDDPAPAATTPDAGMGETPAADPFGGSTGGEAADPFGDPAGGMGGDPAADPFGGDDPFGTGL